QTVAWLDEPGTIPSKPRNGCVIISKKMSAAPYRSKRINGTYSGWQGNRVLLGMSSDTRNVFISNEDI
ncbi:MAG: hypothetical protein E7A16_10195, partial [Bifidobacterium breve]|nr:hypothetical protein [Bifidobacterium breve]